MCKKILNQEYLSAATTKTAMAAATGREINKVQAFTLIVSKQSGKNHREDLIQANVPVKIWAEVTNQSSFAIRPIIKEPGKKAKVEIIDTANVVSMTPLTEFEYNGEHYLRQRVNNNHRFATIRKR